MIENKLKQGLVQVYTGDGKGKTTAALGLGLRAVGHGLEVEMIQYLKGSGYTGELAAVERLDNFQIKQFGKGCKCSAVIKEGLMECTGCGDCFLMDNQDQNIHQKCVDLAYKHSKKLLLSAEKDLIILDEINNALRLKLLSVEDILNLIQIKSEQTELVLTGRGMPEEILKNADLITEMKEVKHPYQAGIKSRWGIEY